MKRFPLLLLAAMVHGCPEPGSPGADVAADLIADLTPAPDAPQPDGAAADTAVDTLAADGTADGGGTKGLPFPYTRPPDGTPVSAADLAAITDKYIDLLKQTHYFDTVDDRVHGWPESDPQKRYWYGTWWSGVGLNKIGGKITFLHVKGGADNNGLRTGPLLEGICLQWSTQALEHLVRKLIRGLNSWIIAMQRQVGDPAGTLLTRAAYPVSIDSADGGRSFHYSLNRPGDDNSATEYVHLTANPHSRAGRPEGGQ